MRSKRKVVNLSRSTVIIQYYIAGILNTQATPCSAKLRVQASWGGAIAKGRNVNRAGAHQQQELGIVRQFSMLETLTWGSAMVNRMSKDLWVASNS